MDILAQLLLAIAVLFLLAIALGLLGVVGRILHWARGAWMPNNPSYDQPPEDRDEWRFTV